MENKEVITTSYSLHNFTGRQKKEKNTEFEFVAESNRNLCRIYKNGHRSQEIKIYQNSLDLFRLMPF